MTDRHIHIITFDIPYPATYGGAIDVFYRLKSLAESGCSITLHCFYKGALQHYEALESLCESVHYYPRHTSWKQQLHLRPYAVVSRTSEQLLTDLLTDDDPILFEGLVSCALIDHPKLAQRDKYLRECNVEHQYFSSLGKASLSLTDKLYYYADAVKLRWFERKVKHCKSVFAIAHQDEEHFRSHYPDVPTLYVPASHPNSSVAIPSGTGQFILYHGNLDVAENYNAARIIAGQIASQLPDIRFVFAGRCHNHFIDSIATDYSNIEIVRNPDEAHIAQLIHDAQIHLLVTEQPTGLKLKLLNVLYNGRHVVVNDKMVTGTELAPLCHVAADNEQLIAFCRQYMHIPVDGQTQQSRKEILSTYYDNQQLATLLTPHIFQP